MKWQCWQCSADDGCELIDLIGCDPLHMPTVCPWDRAEAKWERHKNKYSPNPTITAQRAEILEKHKILSMENLGKIWVQWDDISQLIADRSCICGKMHPDSKTCCLIKIDPNCPIHGPQK